MSNSPKYKDIQFNIIEEEEMQQIFTFEVPNILYFAIFSLKNVNFLSMNWLFQIYMTYSHFSDNIWVININIYIFIHREKLHIPPN